MEELKSHMLKSELGALNINSIFIDTFFYIITALYQIISDLFAAGSDTVTNMLRWVVFYMAKYPEMARRAQKDIDEVVGDQMVSILDKSR